MPSRRIMTISLLTAVVGCGAVLVVAGSASATPVLCGSSQLLPHLESAQGSAGHLHDTWQLVNVGGTCRTQGWVGALNFGPDGRPLPTTVTREGGPSRSLLLTHGQHASWTFSYINPGILGCTPEHAVAQIITPPDNTAPVLARPGQSACSGAVTATPLVLGG